MDDSVRSIAYGALLLVVLLMIFGVILFGLRSSSASRGSAVLSADTHRKWGLNGPALESGIGAACTGLTTAVAAQTVAGSTGATDASGTSVGLAIGVGYGLFITARAKTGGTGRVVVFLRGLAEGLIGLAAIFPASRRYFEAATQCNESSTPLWYSTAVYVLLLVALGWAVVRGVGNMISVRSVRGSALAIFLAVFGALEIGTFLSSPFGLSLIADLPAVGWFVGGLGILLLVIGCLISPLFITAAAGLVLVLSTIVVDVAVGQACAARTTGGAVVLVSHLGGLLVTWVLVKKLFLEAILHVPDARR